MINSNYKVINFSGATGPIDLSEIFYSINSPGATGVTEPTGFLYMDSSGNQLDIINLYSGLISGQTNSTNYKTKNGIDLSNIFQNINFTPVIPQTQFSTTSQLLTIATDNSNTLASNFYLPSGYSYFNFILYGSGGYASTPTSSTQGYSGAGSGGVIVITNIPYNYSGNIISTITYQILNTSTGYTFVNITYSNNNVLQLIAYNGQHTANTQTIISQGGTTSTTIPSFISDSGISYNTYNGANGGGVGQSGSNNGYTCSGSGITSSSNLDPASNNGGTTYTKITPDTSTYSLQSQGGGVTTITSGYGAGGAATPGSYNNNATAYRNGTPGCILYWLSSILET